jgi:glycine cleavage system H protein
MSNPTHLPYTAEHEWVALDGDTALDGATVVLGGVGDG